MSNYPNSSGGAKSYAEWYNEFTRTYGRAPSEAEYQGALALGQVLSRESSAQATSQPAQPAQPVQAAPVAPAQTAYQQAPAQPAAYAAPGAAYGAPGYPAPRRSNTGLILGLVGGGVGLVLVILLVFFMTGVFAVASSSSTPIAHSSTSSSAPYSQSPAPSSSSASRYTSSDFTSSRFAVRIPSETTQDLTMIFKFESGAKCSVAASGKSGGTEKTIDNLEAFCTWSVYSGKLHMSVRMKEESSTADFDFNIIDIDTIEDGDGFKMVRMGSGKEIPNAEGGSSRSGGSGGLI
ncbi:MAG: hypothetical protein Q4P78_02475 [Rothia sp. (in: high G+C Gram-positive bacteria)]|uniref:hypothetical protein n=1 Tax=Rothia sp. (in: high G+C Gram-positive bacteria) TaxID=1885016 RepID=UPI0026DED022|nr:hypothetical protein [Rothia sp. (in: high G+C Gram-positive bacteria)]MDO5750053.1 hypothetical protein [Rothia sp. (in: high G+C Gram-positive bacteria)]